MKSVGKVTVFIFHVLYMVLYAFVIMAKIYEQSLSYE